MNLERPQEKPSQEAPHSRSGVSLHNKLVVAGQDYLTSDMDPLVVYEDLADFLNDKYKEIPYLVSSDEATDSQTEKPEPRPAISAVGIAPFHYYEPAVRYQASSDAPPVKPEVFERARILREPVMAAIGRVIAGGIAQRLMDCSNGSSLDMERLLGKTDNPFRYYSYLMRGFLEDSALDIFMELSAPKHPHHHLLKLAFRVERDFISMIDGPNPKYGIHQKKPSNSPPEVIAKMFWGNYMTDIANFLAAHGIAMQHVYGELPDPSTLVAATAEARPHWLALAALSRKAFGRLIQGEERFALVLNESAATGRFPTWSHFWHEGLDRASLSDYSNNPPYHAFAGCQFQSALLRRKADEPISQIIGSPRRCAGQLGLWLPDDPAMSEFYELVNGSPPEEHRISIAEFVLDLGRTASGHAYADERFRCAIRLANEAINEVSRSAFH